MDIKERFKLFDSYLESIEGIDRNLIKPISDLARCVLEAETGIDTTSGDSESIDVRDIIPNFEESLDTIKEFLANGYSGNPKTDSESTEQLNRALNTLRSGAMKLTNSMDVQKFDINGAIADLDAIDAKQLVDTANAYMDDFSEQDKTYQSQLTDLRNKMDAIKNEKGVQCVTDPEYIELSKDYETVLRFHNVTRNDRAANQAAYHTADKIKNSLDYVKTCLRNVSVMKDNIDAGTGTLSDPSKNTSINDYMDKNYKNLIRKADPNMLQFSDAPAMVPDSSNPEHMVPKYQPNEVAGLLPLDNFVNVVSYGLTHSLKLPSGTAARANEMSQKIDAWIDELNNYQGTTEHELTNLDLTEAKKLLASIPDYNATLRELENEYKRKYDSVLHTRLTKSAMDTLSEELGSLKRDMESVRSIVDPIDQLKSRLDTLEKAMNESKYRSNKLRVDIMSSENQERINAENTSSMESHQNAVMNELKEQPYPDEASDKTFGDALRSIKNRLKYSGNINSNGYKDERIDSDIAALKAFASNYFDHKIDVANDIYQNRSSQPIYKKDTGGYLHQLDKKRILQAIDQTIEGAGGKNEGSVASEYVDQLNGIMTNIIQSTTSETDKQDIADMQRALVKKNSTIQKARATFASKLASSKKYQKQLADIEGIPLSDYMDGKKINTSKFVINASGKYLYQPNSEITKSSVRLPVLVAYEMSQSAVSTGYKDGTFVIQENVVQGDKRLNRWNITFTPNNSEWNVGIVVDFNGKTDVREVSTEEKDISADKLIRYGFEMLTNLFAGK